VVRIVLALAWGVALAALTPSPSSARAPAGARNGSLALAVVDAATGEPVPFANVIRIDPPGGFVAGEDGVVRIDGLEPAVWTLRIVHIAYRDSDPIRLEILPGGVTEGTVALEARTLELPPVRVEAEAPTVGHDAVTGVRTVRAEDVRPLPNPGDDVFQMVRILPGVTSDETGGEFHIRGGDTGETLVRIDGLEVRQLFHGRDYGGLTGIVPFAAVEGVDVYPGGYPAEYGGKLSGVIDVTLREGGREGWHGTVGVDAVSSRAFVESHRPGASLQVSIREGYLDRILRAVRDDFTAQSGYRDLLLRTVRRPHPGTSISLNYLRSEDHIFYDDGVRRHDVDSDYLDHYVWTTARATPGAVALESTLSWTRSRQLRRLSGDDQDDQTLDRLGARAEARWLAGGGHVLRAGGQVGREMGSYRYGSDLVVSVGADGTSATVEDFRDEGRFDRTRTAVFVQDEWRLFRRLSTNVGLRRSRDSDTREPITCPRASAALELPGGLTLRGAWGVYEQAPRVEIDLDEDVQVRSVRRNRAVHRVAGLESRLGSTRLGVDAWDKDFTALDGVVTRAVAGQVERHVIVEGRAHGIEAWMNRSTPGSSWWFSYTLGHSEWGTGTQTFTRDFDRLHAFSLSNTFALPDGWDVGMSYTFHTGTPYTEQNWTHDDLKRQWILEESRPNGERLPDYQRLDVRVRRHFRFDGWEMTAFADALNLTNHENVLWYAWRFTNKDGTRTPERIARTGIPGIPSIGVEFRF